MLDLDRIRRIRLTANPWFQKAVATCLLVPNYYTPPFVKIRFEDEGRVPEGPVIFAMNHTDRYNYWPFQFKAWLRLGRYTATWVKGKYYEHPLLGWFMEQVNSIPTVSRGYIIARDFRGTLGRRPTDGEYAAARAWIDGQAEQLDGAPLPAPDGALPEEILEKPRSILGRLFEPGRESYADAVNALFRKMMSRFVELNAEALALQLDTIIFPQGTRSIRLSKGRIGMSQVALAQERTIVPVGCSGCDHVYPGGSPWARGGTVTYRFGEPLTANELARFRPSEAFEPFTPAAESAHRSRFQELADLVMERIDVLLDEPYRFGEDQESGGVAGSSRFV